MMLALTHRLSFGTALSAQSQRLYWAMCAITVALLPHILQLPPWIPLLFVTTALWRITIEIRLWILPPKWLRILIALSAMLGVALTFRTLNGLDAGSALLATMAGVKLLETRGTRDCTILIFIGYVLLFAALLYDQSLLRLPYILGAAWLLTAALLRLHQSSTFARTRTALKTTGVIVLQALPVAVLLFLFFPRLPGQFWALPSRSNAATGLGDEMTPGDISDLTASGAIAFRVKFEGVLPPPAQRYWRGPVLHEFDGRRWRRELGRMFGAANVKTDGPVYSYRVTMEPTQRAWLFALDMPTQWPEDTTRLYDYQVIAHQPLTTLASFNFQSQTAYQTTATISRTMRAMDTALPGTANPRTRQLAKELRESTGSDAAYIQGVLNKFRTEQFYYTLTPPLLGDDSVDDFLFTTRRGFCEHFASAFTTLMRAAGIPARVITGYQGGEYNRLGEHLTVRQSDAHAWSEVWLEDKGWVRVDPTAAVAPERIERNLDAAIPDSESVPGRFLRSNTFFSTARLTWDAVNNFWNERIVEYNELKQRSLMAWLGIKDADYRELGIAFALTLVLFFVALTSYLGWRYRPRKREPIVAAYDALCRKLARMNLPREPHEGPTTYLQRVASARPEFATELREMRALYTDLRYGPTSLPSEFSRLKYLINRFSGRSHG